MMASDMPMPVPTPFALRQDNRHSQLLTPVSHFPSRMLPPIGTTPRILSSGSSGSGSVPLGGRVEVRRFNIRTKQWMPWTPGVVVGHRVERFHVGTELDLYEVETSQPPQSSTDTYIPFLGELRDGRIFAPSDSVSEMLNRITEMKKVFAYVQVPKGPNGPLVAAWTPAIVISKRSDPTNRVSILAGPLRGHSSIPAPHILPYNQETAEAIKKTGQLIYWENGSC